METAHQLEQREDWSAALLAYNRMLPQVKASDSAQVSELYSHIGNCLLHLGRGNDALSALDKALTLDPNNWNAHLRLAQLFVAAGMPQQTESNIEYVAALRPADPEMLRVRGEMYAAEDRPEIAERDLLRAYVNGPDKADVAIRLAQLYVQQEQIQKARSILSSTASLTPHESRLLFALARLEETQGNRAAAEDAYRKAVADEDSVENNRRLATFLERNGEIAESEQVLRKVDALMPAAPVNVADLELQTGKPQQALRDYEAAFARLIAPQLPGERKIPMHRVERALAARMIEADLTFAIDGDPDQLEIARKHLEIASSSLDPETQNLLQAEIALIGNDLPVATRRAERALHQDPKSPPAHYLMGMIALQEGRSDDAVSQWQAALNADANYVPARLRLASAALKARNGSKAEEYVIDVVRDEPANVEALLLYARALLLEGHEDSARALCQRVLAADPNNAPANVLLGDMALNGHHLAPALLQYEKAMLLEPNSREAIDGLTAVYQDGSMDLKMVHKLEELASNGAPSSRLMEVTGRLYALQHMHKDAKRCLRRAVEMDPDRESAVLALAEQYARDLGATRVADVMKTPEIRNIGRVAAPSTSALVAALQAEQRRDSAESIRQYEAAVRAGDPTGVASNNLAWAYATQGKNLDRALLLARHALELHPANPAVLDTLGIVQVERRQFTEAIASLKTGARIAAARNGSLELQHTIEAHLRQAYAFAGQTPEPPQPSK